MMKTTMPLWIGLTMLTLLLALGASFYFLYMELNEQRNAVVEIEGTIIAQNEQAILVDGTIVALGDQLTQQSAPLADYEATVTAESLPVTSATVIPTIIPDDIVTLTVVPDTSSEPSFEESTLTRLPDRTPTLVGVATDPPEPTEATPDNAPFAIPADVTATPELPVANSASSSITIIFPTEGGTLLAGEDVFLDTIILDVNGVAQAWLAINGIEVKRFSINDFPEFNYTPLWTPTEAGEYELTVGGINSAGEAIRPERVIVTVGNSASDDG